MAGIQHVAFSLLREEQDKVSLSIGTVTCNSTFVPIIAYNLNVYFVRNDPSQIQSHIFVSNITDYHQFHSIISFVYQNYTDLSFSLKQHWNWQNLRS